MVPSSLKKYNYKMKTEQRKQPARAFNTHQRQTYSTNLFQTFKGFSEFTSPSLLQKIQERRAAPAARAPQGLSCTSNEPELPPALQRLSLQPKGCTKQGGKNIKLPARGPKPSTCTAPQHGDTRAPRAELGQLQDFFKRKQLRLLQLFVLSEK